MEYLQIFGTLPNLIGKMNEGLSIAVNGMTKNLQVAKAAEVEVAKASFRSGNIKVFIIAGSAVVVSGIAAATIVTLNNNEKDA